MYGVLVIRTYVTKDRLEHSVDSFGACSHNSRVRLGRFSAPELRTRHCRVAIEVDSFLQCLVLSLSRQGLAIPSSPCHPKVSANAQRASNAVLHCYVDRMQCLFDCLL